MKIQFRQRAEIFSQARGASAKIWHKSRRDAMTLDATALALQCPQTPRAIGLDTFPAPIAT